MAWRALRPNGNVPSRHVFPPPSSSSGRSGKSSTLRAPQSKQGKVPAEPPWARVRGLGWIWALGKAAHFAGTEALPPVIPHTGTKLGALARRKGLGCRVAEPNTQLIPCWLCKLKQYSPGVACVAVPVTTGTTPDQKGLQPVLNPYRSFNKQPIQEPILNPKPYFLNPKP